MWIARDIEPRLKRSAKTRPVIVLTGARQTGKTSTFLHIFPGLCLRLPRFANRGRAGGERARALSPAPSAAGHYRRSAICARSFSEPQGGCGCPPDAQRAIPAYGLAEVHPDEECLRVSGRKGRHCGTRYPLLCEIREALPDTELEAPLCAAAFRSSMLIPRSIPWPFTTPISPPISNATCAPWRMSAACAISSASCAPAPCVPPTC